MAQMNIDLNRLEKIGQEDLDDAKTRRRLYQYLYQLSEQLKYWQYHVEEENLTPALQEKIAAGEREDVETKSASVNDDGIQVKDKDGNITAELSQNGDLVAQSVTAGSLTVGGKELGTVLEEFLSGRIVISETQPEGHGIVWIQPEAPQSGTAAATTAEYTATGNGMPMTGDTATMTFRRSGADAAEGAKCTYGIRFRARNLRGVAYLDTVTVTATGTDEDSQTQTVTILHREDIGQYVGAGDMVTVDTLADPSEELANITHGATISVTVTLGLGGTGARTVNSEVFTLRCAGVQEGGQPTPAAVRSCAVKYIT